MIKFPVIILCAFILFACTDERKLYNTLSEVESYIETEPEKALIELKKIRNDIGISKKLKAKHALLYSMALDKNYVDVTNDSIIAPAIEYYSNRGSNDEKLLAHYYMGRIYQNSSDVNNAALEFSKAEQLIEDSHGNPAIGRLYMAFADLYNSAGNSIKEIEYVQKGCNQYKDFGPITEYNKALGRLAIAYANNRDWDIADSLYNESILHCYKDTVVMSLFLSNYARLKVLRPNKNPSYALELLNRKYKDYKLPLSIKDCGIYAYCLTLLGKQQECNAMLGQFKNMNYPELDYWLYLINTHNGKYKEAIDMLNKSYIQLDKKIHSYLTNTIDLSIKDYYKEQEYLNQIKFRNRIFLLIIILCVVITTSSLIVLILVRHNNRQKKDIQRYLKFSEDAHKQLDNYENRISSQNAKIESLQKLYAQTYKKQFKSIGELCLTYLTRMNSKDIKEILFKKVVHIIDNLSVDDTLHLALEEQINKELDNILVHLKEDIPSLSHNDIRFVCYCIIGFDGTLISTILNMSTSNVYTKKSRLRVKIDSISSPYKDLYLLYI